MRLDGYFQLCQRVQEKENDQLTVLNSQHRVCIKDLKTTSASALEEIFSAVASGFPLKNRSLILHITELQCKLNLRTSWQGCLFLNLEYNWEEMGPWNWGGDILIKLGLYGIPKFCQAFLGSRSSAPTPAGRLYFSLTKTIVLVIFRTYVTILCAFICVSRLKPQ